MFGWFFLKKKIVLLKIWRLAVTLLRTGGHISKYPPFVLDFESDFARYIGCKHGMSFCNGSSALEAALFAVGIRPGDEVLVSSCTIHSTAAAIIAVGAQPIYVDIDPNTLNFDPEEIDKKVTDKTRGLIVVHLWGNPADMMAIKKKAEKYQLKIIEDCSHAHGAILDGQKVGSFGDVGCFSLQGYKAISAAEGGIAVTDKEDYYHRLTLFGHFGRNADAVSKTRYKEFLSTGIDTKRRANPLGICIAAVDLKYLDRKNMLKRRFIQKVERILDKVEGIEKVQVLADAQKGGFFPAHPAIVKPERDKNLVFQEIKKHFRGHRFPGSPKFFKGPEQPYHRLRHLNDLKYREWLIWGAETPELPAPEESLPRLENTETILDRVILIPFGK